MKSMSRYISILSVLLAVVFLFTSCAPAATPEVVQTAAVQPPATSESPAATVAPTEVEAPPPVLETQAPVEEPATAEAPATDGEPKQGGTLVVAVAGEPPHLMGLNQQRDVQYLSGQLFPALLKYDLDVNPMPYLAESWEISDDGLTYTFNLVKDAQWTDGTPITSADVKFSIEDMAVNYHPSGKQNFSLIDVIETPDDSTVVIKLKQPFAPMMKLLGHMTALVLPKHIYEGTDPFSNSNSLDAKVTGGPFVLDEWVKGDHITLKRNEQFFRKGLPYLDRVIFRFIPDSSIRVLALQSNEVDYIAPGAFPSSEIDNLETVEGIEVVDSGSEATYDVATFGFNLRKPPLDNVMVRKALSHAIDKDFILEAASFGHSGPGVGPLTVFSWAFDDSLKGPEYDPQKAEQMLDEAGFPRKDDGWRFSLTLNTRPALFIYAKANEIMADNLRAIGVDAKLNPLETAAYFPAMYENWDFDLSGGLFINGYDPDNMAAIYTCDQIKPILFSNFMGYCNPEVDELFKQAVQSLDDTERKDLYTQIQEKIIEDAPALWVLSNVDWVGYNSSYHNLPPGPWNGRDPMDEVWTENP